MRLQWFGDEIESIREFDPASQRSLHTEGDRLDALAQVTLTPISFTPLIAQALRAADHAHLISEDQEGLRRYLGVAFPQPGFALGLFACPNPHCRG